MSTRVRAPSGAPFVVPAGATPDPREVYRREKAAAIARGVVVTLPHPHDAPRLPRDPFKVQVAEGCYLTMIPAA